MGAADPVGAHCPLTTLVHCASALRPVAPLHVPPGHGVGADEPSLAQYDATEHGLQEVALVTFWYSPGLHGTQLPRPLVLAAEPGLHALGCVAPVVQAEPGGHSVQLSFDARPSAAP